MKKVWLIAIAIFFLCSAVVFAGDTDMHFKPLTGDSMLDLSLEKLNTRAMGNLDDFINDLNKSYGVAREKIDLFLTKDKMNPADVYMAAKVSQAADTPIDDVVTEFKSNKGKGWGAVAQKMGIKPGSKEFHALKEDKSGMLGKGDGGNAGEGTKEKQRKRERKQSKAQGKGKKK